MHVSKLLYPRILALILLSSLVVTAADTAAEVETRSVESAHRELWRRFMSPHGTIYDFVGLNGEVLLPTPEDCRDSKPNALGWTTPIENGAFFGGLYLDALCNRWKTIRTAAAADKARTVAAGLLLLADIGGTPGFIARGVASDGRSHYAASSSDQTYPWFYGMWRYANSGIPTSAERQRVVATMERVARGLEANQWQMPVDRANFGHFGHWSVGFDGTKGVLVGAEPQFDAGSRLLFVLRAMHQLTGDYRWLEQYYARLAEKPRGSDKTRQEICAFGVDYVAPGEPPRFPESPRLWTSASSQAGLRALVEMETDAGIRDSFQKGMEANAARAAKYISWCIRYDNDTTLAFDIRWRALNAVWKEQKEIGEAVQLGRLQKGDGSIWHKQSPKFWTESYDMRDPLFAAWVVALSGSPEIIGSVRTDMRTALTHYRWERLHTGFFFMAECVYWQLRQQDDD